MKFEPVKLVHVYYMPNNEKILVGRLALKSRKIFFEYDTTFLKKGLNLSPFTLPLKSAVTTSGNSTFDGLFGVFNDSLPDGWGRLVLDRYLIQHNLNPKSLSALDRLCFVGSRGMGALVYEPAVKNTSITSNIDLDKIAREIIEFQENNNDVLIDDLLNLSGSSGGARPKIEINTDKDNWLVKFRSSNDPQDIGAIEYAYHLMAKEAGINMSKAKLFSSRQGLSFFGSSRFDRNNLERIHMHSISGLLHADHRIPSLDYQIIMKITMYLTSDINECEKQYRQCVFNILSHNRDDHAKNFSFLMDNNGVWRVSPAYDITFSSGPNGEHCSMIMGEGKNPNISHFLDLAKVSNIKQSNALEIINQVKFAVSQWSVFAKNAGVSASSRKMIKNVIEKLLHN